MRKFFMTSGIPGSGKTYFRDNNFKKDVLVISPDDKIGYTKEDPWTPQKAKQAWKLSDTELKESFKDEEQELILFDATFTTPKTRKKYIKWARKANIDPIAIYVNPGFKICTARNDAREESRKVPFFIMKNMSNKLQSPTVEEGYSVVIDVQRKVVYHNGDQKCLDHLCEIVNLTEFNKQKERLG